MKKLLKIPYFLNDGDGSQCLQVCMKSLIKYFLDKDISMDELDKMTSRPAGKWAFTQQAIPTFIKLGLKVKYYSSMELEPFTQGEEFLKKHFGKNAETYLKHIDVNVMVESAKETLKLGVFEKRKLTLDEILAEIDKGNGVIMAIDWDVLEDINDSYEGHFVVVTGYDKDNIYYHESGPAYLMPGKDITKIFTANRKVSKEKFWKAFDTPGTDNDILVVSK